MTWAVGWSVRQTGYWPHPWLEMYSAVLVVFFLAHQWLTWRVLRTPSTGPRRRWLSLAEGGLALGAALSGVVLVWF